MISAIQGLAYSMKDIIETTPIQFMLIAIPVAIILLATISTATAKAIEVFVSKK